MLAGSTYHNAAFVVVLFWLVFGVLVCLVFGLFAFVLVVSFCFSRHRDDPTGLGTRSSIAQFFLVHLLTKMAELHTALINVLHATACRSTWRKPRGDGREKYLAFFSVHRLVAFARSINKLLHEMN